MIKLWLCITLAIGLPSLAIAADFSIEQKDLAPVSKSIEAAVKKSVPYALGCPLVGKPIDLSGQDPLSGFVVTDTCPGSAGGPVWMLVKKGKSYRVVLDTAAYNLSLQNKKNNGLYDIVASEGAAYYTREVWSFTGKHYQKTRSESFDFKNEEVCKAHKDICPFEVP